MGFGEENPSFEMCVSGTRQFIGVLLFLSPTSFFKSTSEVDDSFCHHAGVRTEEQPKKKKKKVQFMYLVFTCMSGESYRRQLNSLLLYYVFRVLINSLVG